MISVYVIESSSDQTWYTGMAIDPIKRLAEQIKTKIETPFWGLQNS